MKKLFCCIVLLMSMMACGVLECTYKGYPLHKGKRGGCYYINKNGNKQYVNRQLCNCK